ncbi:MAG: protein kinase, partial [Chloroflexota bacterium]|nr:protein kinase [Chloroflexota bacterium]
DVGESNGMNFIVEEFVDGVTLGDLIQREGRLPLARVANIVSQVASALDYAHALGYIHRDVKPGNIMIGANDHATLTDFGIVKAAEGTRMTKSGVMMGTPEYMSPEQIRGQAIDLRADVYAFGLVGYEMLGGRTPFQGDTARVLYCQVHEQPPSLRLLNPRVPPIVEQVIAGALAKEPAQRYSSAGEFANALSAAASGVPIAPRGGVEPPTRFVPPPKRSQTTMVVLVAGLTAAFALVCLCLALVFGINSGVIKIAALSSPTPTMTVTATATLPPPATATSLSTATSLPTSTFTPFPTSTLTRMPTLSATRPPAYTPTLALYPAPVITTPVTYPTLGPGDLVITWDFQQPLGEDDWFQVVAWKEQSSQEHHAMTWTKEHTFTLNGNVPRTIQMFPWIGGAGGQYYFAVQVIRGKDGKFMGELSRESAPWPWRW